MSEQRAEPEPTFEEMIPGSTCPEVLSFDLKGFASEDQAKDMANWTNSFIKIIGTKLNLETLDGVTIAFDYPQALADLDRGYETTFVLKPSSEFAQGVAMAPGVRRDGIVKTHILFDANVFTRFRNPEDEHWNWMYYQLAHECGHVHDRRAFDLAIPNVLLTQHYFGNELNKIRWELGENCWCEYAASRLSAEYYPGQVVHYEETFMATLEGLDERADAIMDKFLDDKEGIECFRSLGREYEVILKFASYLLGHLNGTGGDIDTAPKFKEFIKSDHWLSYRIIELDKAFDGLWDNYGKWKGIEDFDCLGELVLEAVGRHGVYARMVDDQMFVTIQ
ncbi:hypothetical protein ABIF97_006980 [Bradyrhizobium japonicum]